MREQMVLNLQDYLLLCKNTSDKTALLSICRVAKISYRTASIMNAMRKYKIYCNLMIIDSKSNTKLDSLPTDEDVAAEFFQWRPGKQWFVF